MSYLPSTMATQHPDNASVPWWKNDESPFIATQDEIGELIELFRNWPIDEYMWDWEGKYVDEAVGEKLYSQAKDLFDARPLGQDLHVTFRIPAFDGTKMNRMARAFMNLLSLADLTREIGVPSPAVKEMFLPLTTSASQLLKVREVFQQVAAYHRSIFSEDSHSHDELLAQFQVTPLVEGTASMFTIEDILRPYWESLISEKKDLSMGQRIFLARSDPALNSGLVAAVLAVKAALSTATELGEELGFSVHPIVGTGSLPFRGSVNPKYCETFLNQYRGVRTYSIQSAFRYDYPADMVREALETIQTEAPKSEVQRVLTEDHTKLQEIADTFRRFWQPSIEALAPTINRIAALVPARRERVQHIGLFGYNRGVGKVTLPRAIKFTASFYSLGIPPELMATGRGLREVQAAGLMPLIETYYPALPFDLEHAGKFFNRENLELLKQEDPVFAEIEKDIAGIEDFLGKPIGPLKPRHMIHRNLTSTIYHRLFDAESNDAELQHDIVEAGKIRRSLG